MSKTEQTEYTRLNVLPQAHKFLTTLHKDPRVIAWCTEQNAKVIDIQTGTRRERYLSGKTGRGDRIRAAFYGSPAMFSGYNISLEPTSIGVGKTLTNVITGDTLGLSDVDLW